MGEDMRSSGSATSLEAAIAVLIHNQAQFVQAQAQFAAEIAKLDRRYNELREETARRFAHIEALLLEHDRLLKGLPDAIKDKIGFKN
jgi:cell division protein FtsB